MDAKTFKSLVERAEANLGVDASPAAQANIKEKLSQLSTALVLEWLLGEKRFESQSQQTEHWLSRFYEDIFNDEQPDPNKIYQRFGLSLPRASYMARMLRARHAAQWRAAARKEVKTQLSRKKKDAETSKKNNTGDIDEFDLSFSKGAADELRVLYDRVSSSVDEKERPRPPKSKPSFGSTLWFAVPAETLLLILEAIEKEAKS